MEGVLILSDPISCRRKDSSKPLSDAEMSTPSHTPSPSTARPILPPRIPTGASTSSRSSRHSDHNSKTDLDPTEWKPKLDRQARNPTNSEAFLYLSRFHQSNPSLRSHASPHMPRSQSTTNMGAEEGQGMRTVSSTSLNTLAPSLSRTPTTGASSLSGSVELTIHPAVSYDFNTRPLPSRRDPNLSSTGRGSGVDLVVPYAPPKASGKNMDGAGGYGEIRGGLGSVEMGGLGKLLKGENGAK